MAIILKQKQQFIELRAEGHSFDFIKKKLGISKPKLVKMDKELHEEIEEVITIKEEQFISELRASNMNEVKRLVALREKVYAELEMREPSKMNNKELLLFAKNIEDQISNKTNIDQFKKDLYRGNRELRERMDEYEKQIEVLKLLPSNSNQSNNKEVYKAEDLQNLKARYPVKLTDPNEASQQQNKNKSGKEENEKE